MTLVIKNPPANAGIIRDAGSIPRFGMMPWRKAWQPTPVFLPGESHGQRSLAGYSPGGSQRVRHDSDFTFFLYGLACVLSYQALFSSLVQVTLA